MLRLIKKRQYKQESAKGKIPIRLKSLLHKCPWPVLTDKPIYIKQGFDEKKHYYTSNYHPAIDLQADSGSAVISPIRGRVVYLEYDIRAEGNYIEDLGMDYVLPAIPDPKFKNLIDLYLWDRENKLVCILCHLDGTSIPNKIKGKRNLDMSCGPEVEMGEFIGRIGKFPNCSDEDRKIPKAVKRIYGNQQHHIHLETHYYPTSSETSRDFLIFLNEQRYVFNPLLILQEI